MSSFDFEIYSQRVEKLIDTLLSAKEPKKLFAAMRYSSLGGKHLRALLCYATSVDLIEAKQMKPLNPINLNNLNNLNNGNQSKHNQFHPSDAIAVAIELVHSYSLVHDDLPAMDDDDLRRGKPAAHKAFGEALAILLGDGLQSYAFEILAKGDYQQNSLQEIVGSFAKLIGSEGMVGGQMLDIDPSQLTSKKSIIAMYQLKTAKLITASVLLPYLASERKQPLDEKFLHQIGNHLGLYFQIQDDLLEQSGSDIGKPSDSDARNQKSTLSTHLSATELQKMQADLVQKIDKNLNQLSFEAKNLKALTGKIRHRGY